MSAADDAKEQNAVTSQWKITRLIEERTGNAYLGIDFPTNLGGQDFLVIEEDLAENPTQVRLRLKGRGARLRGTKKEQIAFVAAGLRKIGPKTLTLAMKPGFRDGGFVLGHRMLGTAKGKYRWRTNPREPQLGDFKGDLAVWNEDVGEVALKSSYLTFAICCALAAPVLSYVRDRTSAPLLSEGTVFNFSGESGSGKTVLTAAAAGVFGPPRLIGKWDFSRRGLEERAEARHDLLLALDDIEKHVENGMSLKTALRHVNQIIPSGQSKDLSRVAQDAGLPPLVWSSLGLTSSPRSLEKIAIEVGWRRSQGERVRFPDIPLPLVKQAGIFDCLEGEEAERIDEGKALIKKLEGGVDRNFGLIFPLWIDFLLAEDRSSRVLELVNHAVRRLAPHADGWEERFTRKFGLVYAVGRLAAEARILPWPKDWPAHAIAKCYRRAVGAIRSEETLVISTIFRLGRLSASPKYFVRVRSGSQVQFSDTTIGLQTLYTGNVVLALRNDALESLAGSRRVARAVLTKLQDGRVLIGGHGHARTTQLPVSILVHGKAINSPRFWVIHLARLRELIGRLERKEQAAPRTHVNR